MPPGTTQHHLIAPYRIAFPHAFFPCIFPRLVQCYDRSLGGEHDMSDICNHLQHRIEEARHDLQSVVERIQQATAERDLLTAELQGYEKALAAEMRRDGVSVPEPARQIQLPIEAPKPERWSKAEFARKFFREHADAGATPGDLYDRFVECSVSIKKPYVYSLVQRLQAQNVIRKKRGKWFPVQESQEAPGAGSGG